MVGFGIIFGYNNWLVGDGNKMLHLLHCDRVDFELHSFSTTENTKMSIKINSLPDIKNYGFYLFDFSDCDLRYAISTENSS